VFNVIHFIRDYIEQHNKKEDSAENQIYVSDRRWRKITRLLRTSAFLNDRTEVDLMDCFLIKHCIWNDEEQIDAVFQFVSSAVEKHGYTVSFDFDNVKKELAEFQTEIDEETKFVKDTRKKVLECFHARSDPDTYYYKILNPPSQNDDSIRKTDFNNLSNDNQGFYLYYWRTNYERFENHSRFNIRKGNSKFSIFVNDTEYQLKTEIQGDKRQKTKRPSKNDEKAWDERTAGFLQHTGEMKEQIEQYRNKDLEHLRTNLFVKPELANIVETHITETLKEIDKIEIQIREIQNNYKKLKDEEIVVK
jgi:MoxR-like ATPase